MIAKRFCKCMVTTAQLARTRSSVYLVCMKYLYKNTYFNGIICVNFISSIVWRVGSLYINFFSVLHAYLLCHSLSSLVSANSLTLSQLLMPIQPWLSCHAKRDFLVVSYRHHNHHQNYYSHSSIKVYRPVELEPGQHSQYSDSDYGLDDNWVQIPAGSRNISISSP